MQHRPFLRSVARPVLTDPQALSPLGHSGPRHKVRFDLILCCTAALLLALPLTVRSQSSAPVVAPAQSLAAAARDASTEVTLESLLRAIHSNADDRAMLRETLKRVHDPDQAAELEERIKQLREEEDQLIAKFESTATGSDILDYERDAEEEIELSTEMTRLLLPMVSELKIATSSSRDLAALRQSIAEEQRRYTIAQSAATRAASLVTATTNAVMKERLQVVADTWLRKAESKKAELSALEHELEERNANRKSLLTLSRLAMQQFFSTRWRNLTLGVFAFITVLLLVRLVGRTVERWAKSRPTVSTFFVRLIQLMIHVLSILTAIAALLLTLNFTGDWFLLGLVILLLFGAAWAMLKTLPNIYEQLKLILNLGAVRERELIVFDGIAWKVESLGFMAQMVNPRLDGGQVELPVRELVGHHSRTMGAHELLFPTSQGDWILLPGERHAKVVTQTPSVVEIIELGGARTAIPTTDFLAMHPTNLSHNFRVSSVFGVDYQHQALCTTDIPELMQAVIQKGFVDTFSEQAVLSIKVKFLRAGASSLDYELIADMHGSCAERHRDVVRSLQSYAVDACNKHGWVIPFTQVTLHQATTAAIANGTAGDLHPARS